jgi:uncharacterized protein with HEPN domain
MPPDAGKFLHDVVEACGLAAAFVKDVSLLEYREDVLRRSAVERQLQIACEAVYALRKISPETVDQLSESARMISFRHILVHAYDRIDDEIVWAVEQDKLPILLDEATELLKKLPPA